MTVAALGIDTINLYAAEGTRWIDPDLRQWESLGFGEAELWGTNIPSGLMRMGFCRPTGCRATPPEDSI